MGDRVRVLVTDAQGGIVDQFWIVREETILDTEVREILEEHFVITEVSK